MFSLRKISVLFSIVTACAAFYVQPCCNTYNPVAVPQFGGCQDYDIKLENGRLIYKCLSYSEKMGSCPTNTTEYKHLTNSAFGSVQCIGDWFCPFGFKCCPEDAAKPAHICKRAVLPDQKETDQPTNAEQTDKQDGQKPGNKPAKPGKPGKPTKPNKGPDVQ